MQSGVPCEVIIPLDSYIPGRQSVDWRARRLVWLEIHGRLRPGVSIEEAQSELRVLWPTILDDTTPLDATGERATRFRSPTVGVESAARGASRYQRTSADPLLVLSTIVGLLLMIVCVNIATLMLAHAASRRRETAVRMAVGVGKTQVLRQSAFESLLLAMGVRLAIGADRWRVLSWALLRTVWVPLAGVGMGLQLAMVTGRSLESVLFGVPSANLGYLLGAGACPAVISLLSTLSTALQTALIQPMSVLREG